MKTLEEIGIEIGFETKSLNYRKAFYDKYIRVEKLNYEIIAKHSDLIHIFNLKDKLNWYYICKYQKLSEEFIREFHNKLDWAYISTYQKLSEDFMREFKDKLHCTYISTHQKLSESFIRKFSDKLDWLCISKYQKLSESFMREFSDKLDWYYICIYQKLSESFMREFSYKLEEWFYISRYQKLSESFMIEFSDRLEWSYISEYQYSDDKLFEHDLKDLSLYDIKDDYVYGYKAVRTDRYSIYNFQYHYEDGSIHECFSDQTDDENSFGLSIGTKEFANDYGDGKHYTLLYVRTKISDITRIVHGGQKIRSRKIEILNEVEK